MAVLCSGSVLLAWFEATCALNSHQTLALGLHQGSYVCNCPFTVLLLAEQLSDVTANSYVLLLAEQLYDFIIKKTNVTYDRGGNE